MKISVNEFRAATIEGCRLSAIASILLFVLWFVVGFIEKEPIQFILISSLAKSVLVGISLLVFYLIVFVGIVEIGRRFCSKV